VLRPEENRQVSIGITKRLALRESLRTAALIAKYKLLGALKALWPWEGRFRYHEQVTWWRDRSWAEPYRRFLLGDAVYGRDENRILDRRFFAIQTALSVADLPGSTAECGVRRGTGSGLICQALCETYGAACEHFAFDSFEGLPEPNESDRMKNGRHKWKKGKLRTEFEQVRELLADFSFCRVVKGWIPESLAVAAGHQFRFVHIDVDLHRPTWDSLAFFYPRIVAGGVILLDDHGFANCPGARKAAESFFADKPERIIEAPTGQALVIKR
jgi:hypothetical protein